MDGTSGNTKWTIICSMEHEADHLPPSSTKVKNVWSYTSIPQNVFMV
jgi:hypothetical protein